MGVEVYVINFVIGILTFLILRWILKKFITTNRVLRTILTCIGTIVLTPIIYTGLIVAMIAAMFYEPTKDFNKEQWIADKSKRYEMRDNLVESELLKNKTKEEILGILGPPAARADSVNVWDYDLGTSQAGFGWQFNNLIITFDNDRVTKVEKTEIVD